MGMIKEFKDFAMRGNVVDMAVGVIIGGAFGAITNSLVKDVIMPPLGLMLGELDFSSLAFTIREKTATAEAITLRYGLFINSIVNFLIVAFTMFMVIRQMNRIQSKLKDLEGKDAPVAEPSTKTCNFCQSTVHVKATRCPNCTSQLV